jgi:hypothetical protein
VKYEITSRCQQEVHQDLVAHHYPFGEQCFNA